MNVEQLMVHYTRHVLAVIFNHKNLFVEHYIIIHKCLKTNDPFALMYVTEGGVKGRLFLFSYSWNRTTSVPKSVPRG